MQIELQRDHVTLVVGEHRVRLAMGEDEHGTFVQLGGENCDLEGEAHGLYYLQKSTEATA